MMKTIQPRKEESNSIIVESPKKRGWMPPPSKRFEDKRIKNRKWRYYGSQN
jgi:hypothetical protein